MQGDREGEERWEGVPGKEEEAVAKAGAAMEEAKAAAVGVPEEKAVETEEASVAEEWAAVGTVAEGWVVEKAVEWEAVEREAVEMEEGAVATGVDGVGRQRRSHSRKVPILARPGFRQVWM